MIGKGIVIKKDWIDSNFPKNYGGGNIPVGAKEIISSISFMNPL